MFERFPSLTRFSHGWTVTEKIDGTNACILIAPIDDPAINHGLMTARVGDTFLFTQSRNKIITPTDDNAGFAKYVEQYAPEIVEALGEGRHYGEWWGKGIQRNYGMTGKKFSLFNAARWSGPMQGGKLPAQMDVVPHFVLNDYIGNTSTTFDTIMEKLKMGGSLAAPGFMNPEGIVMFHRPSGTTFKKTFDYDEQGKWAEKPAR